MRGYKTCLTVLALFLLSGCCPLPDNHLTNTHYAATQHIMLTEVLPPPPPAGSARDKKDMSAVLEAQKERTAAQISEAQLDADLSLFRFRPALGTKFTAQNLPVTTAFFENVKDDEDRVVHLAKVYYARPRPYTASKQVKPVVPHPPNASYPSGHAAFAYVDAILLAQALPEKKTQIFNRAARFAQNRIIAGVHYPTDIQAGMISASVIVEELMKDKQFTSDFDTARQELRHVLLDKP